MKLLYRLIQALLILLDIVLIILTVAGFSFNIVIGIIFLVITVAIIGLILSIENKYKKVSVPKENVYNIPVNKSIPKRVDSNFTKTTSSIETTISHPTSDTLPTAQIQVEPIQTIIKKKPKEIYRPSVVTNQDDIYLRYFYKYVKIATNHNEKDIFKNINIGDEVELIQEPTNEYDRNAVAVYVNKSKIGYLYKGTLQEMCNKWLSNDDISVLSVVTDINVELEEVYIYLAFYDVLSEKRYENKFKVTLSENKYYDNYILEHEPLYISYDYGKEKYLIDDWGTVPKSSISFFENIDGDNDYTSFVENIKENDSGSYTITIVTVYTKSNYNK